MRTAAFAVAFIGLYGTASAAGRECAHQAERQERVEAAGASTLRVIARAGSLQIQGRSGGEAAVVARGTACARTESVLAETRLRASRSGATVTVEAEIPDNSGWMGGDGATLDMVIEVPSGMSVTVEDGSGSTSIRNVAAASVKDGSGELVLEAIAGDVRITDGSGSIQVRDAGSVTIDEDGSGSIEIAAVRGSVIVHDDGSGSIDVRDVAGDFTVEDDGSGGITHDAVRGRVRVPRRD